MVETADPWIDIFAVDLEVAGPETADPWVDIFAVDLEVAGPETADSGVYIFAVDPVADVAEPQASVDIVLAFDVLVPVSAVVGEVDSSVRPKFPAFPNADHFASSSSSVEVVGEEPAHNPTGARANYGLCSSLSNLGLHQNKNEEHCYNNSSFDHSNVSETNDLPRDATTNHSRKKVLYRCQEKHRHSSQVLLLPLAVRQIRYVEAKEY